MKLRTIVHGSLYVALGAALGAGMALTVMRHWLREEQARQEHDIEVLTKSVELTRLELELQRLREENHSLMRAPTTGDAEEVDGGIRRPFEFIDVSKPGRPVRQLCDCDSRNRCRCY